MLPLRVLLSPFYVVSELIRQPIGALVTAAERADLPRKAYELFMFAPDHKGGIMPVGFVAFGLKPSIGVYGFWNDAVVAGNDFRVHVETWPDEWVGASMTDRWRFDRDGDALQVRTAVLRRPDNPFYGLGPRSRQADQSRYTATRFDANLSLQSRWWRNSRVLASSGMGAVEVAPGHYSDDPSVDEQANMGVFALPFGFGSTYAGPTGRLYASVDTRAPNANTGSGLRLEAHATAGSAVTHGDASGWLRYGAIASGELDLDSYGRTVELSITGLFADPLTSEPIPFTELVTLGGRTWMTGYLPGRLVDRSAALVSLRYNWPVALYIEGTLQGTVGNVFGAHLDGFDPGLFRFSGGFGLRTTTDPPVELLFGFGTDTFDNGATVQSGRVSFGVPQSF